MGPGLLLYFLITDRSARDPIVVAACAIGFLVGVAPILFFLARDYQSFWRWNVEVHQLILQLRVDDLGAALLRITKAMKDFALLMSVPIGFVIVATLKAWRRGGAERREHIGKVLLLAFAAIMAVSPLYVFEQYLGPLAFLLFLFSAPWNSSSAATRSWYVLFAGVLLCLQCVIMARWIAPYLTGSGELAVASVVRLQNKAKQIVGGDYTCARKFYSAAPLFLLANDVRYPPELAAGPFLMFMRGEALARTGREFDLDGHLKNWNPDVVIWGYYTDSPYPNEKAADRTIRDYALQHKFVTTALGQIEGHRIELGYRAGCKPSLGRVSTRDEERRAGVLGAGR